MNLKGLRCARLPERASVVEESLKGCGHYGQRLRLGEVAIQVRREISWSSESFTALLPVERPKGIAGGASVAPVHWRS